MENTTLKHVDHDEHEEEIPDSFCCCVCLDLLYKPIVLSCGYMCCFWCIHKSMSGVRESKCPTCRHQYYHFPTVCQLLHFLLLKLYPVAYNRRTNQTLGMSISLTVCISSLEYTCVISAVYHKYVYSLVDSNFSRRNK